MSDRTVPFDEDAVCDICGEKGAYDFIGDFLCPECVDKAIEEPCNRCGHISCICGT